jgi:putative transposase
MKYNAQKHNRRSIRLKNYNYSQEGSYFITLCIEDRQHLFGTIKNDIMGLNIFGCIAYEEWQKTPLIRKNISLGAFIVMPNHIHGIIHIDKQKKNTNQIGLFHSPSQTIGAIIRGYKGAATKRIKASLRSPGELKFAPTKEEFAPTKEEFAPTKEEFALGKELDLNKSIWQRNYYENIIKDNKAYWNITNYIWNNPQSWTKDKFH